MSDRQQQPTTSVCGECWIKLERSQPFVAIGRWKDETFYLYCQHSDPFAPSRAHAANLRYTFTQGHGERDEFACAVQSRFGVVLNERARDALGTATPSPTTPDAFVHAWRATESVLLGEVREAIGQIAAGKR